MRAHLSAIVVSRADAASSSSSAPSHAASSTCMSTRAVGCPEVAMPPLTSVPSRCCSTCFRADHRRPTSASTFCGCHSGCAAATLPRVDFMNSWYALGVGGARAALAMPEAEVAPAVAVRGVPAAGVLGPLAEPSADRASAPWHFPHLWRAGSMLLEWRPYVCAHTVHLYVCLYVMSYEWHTLTARRGYALLARFAAIQGTHSDEQGQCARTMLAVKARLLSAVERCTYPTP